MQARRAAVLERWVPNHLQSLSMAKPKAAEAADGVSAGCGTVVRGEALEALSFGFEAKNAEHR